MHSSCAFLSKMLSKLSIINLFKRDASNWLCVDDFRGAGHGIYTLKNKYCENNSDNRNV